MRRAPLEVPPLQLPEATLRVHHWQRSLGRPHNGGWIRVEPRDGSPPWELPVYTVHYHPDLEEDVQDIFILRLEAHPLAIVDESGRKFGLCLQSRSLTPAEPDPWKPLFDQLSPAEAREFGQALQLLKPPAPNIPDPFAATADDDGDVFGLLNRLPHTHTKLFWQICYTDLPQPRWPATAAMLWGAECLDSGPEPDFTQEQQRDHLQQSLMKHIIHHPDLDRQQLQTHHQQLRQELGLPVHPPELYQRAAEFVGAHYREALEWPFPEELSPPSAQPTLHNPLQVAHDYLRRLGLSMSLEGPQGEYWQGVCAHYLEPRLLALLFSPD